MVQGVCYCHLSLQDGCTPLFLVERKIELVRVVLPEVRLLTIEADHPVLSYTYAV